MAKVFISYSRRDIEFAKRLTAELKKSELDFWIDWEGIPPTVDWWKEIEKGIEESDAFLFLISPDSAKSKVCGQEIDCAVTNGKRLIPIVARDIQGDETPPQLRHLNWIFFRESDDFEASLKKLLTAIHTDYAWVQAHRQLQVKALEWERHKRENSFLLQGKELQEAEFQLATNTSKEPHPTDLQREYVFTSRTATDRQRRALTGIAIAGVIVMAALAAFGLVQAQQAGSARAEAVTSLYVAQTAQAVAQDKQIQADNSAATAQANANVAATAQAAAIASSNLAATAQVNAENAKATTDQILAQVQAVSGYRAQALVSFSQKAGGRNSPLAALLAVSAYQTAANGTSVARLFELLQGDLQVGQFDARKGVYVVNFSPQGNQLAVGYNDKNAPLSFWQIADGSEVALADHRNSVYSVAFSPDGQVVASGDFDGQIILWDAQAHQPLGAPLDGHDRIFSLAFSPDGRWLAAGGVDQKISIWDTATWQQARQLEGHQNTVNSLAFSPDGRRLVSGDNDGKLIVWDMAAFQIQQTLEAPDQTGAMEIMHLAFSPDGKTIASGDNGGVINIWKVDAEVQFAQALPQQSQRISTLAFSPEGQWLASGSYDGQVLLWNTVNFDLVTKIPLADKSRVYSVRFNAAGTLLAVGNQSGAVTLWNMDPAFWLAQTCALAGGKNYTGSEWGRYFPGEDYRDDTCK